jgi:plasmid stabilization system protein ParE
MKRSVVSAEAQADIDLIVDYTTDTWSCQQTDRYLGQLEDSFQLLAKIREWVDPAKQSVQASTGTNKASTLSFIG